MTGDGRLVPLDGYPPLCRDITRNLLQGARRLAEDGDGAVVFDRDQAALAAQWFEVTAVRTARNLATGRPAGLGWWRATWAQATELATLRVGGELAAWLLAAPAGPVYRVLAGQMDGRFRDQRAGRVLEALVVARALGGPPPWPPLPDAVEAALKAVTVTLGGGPYTAHALLDWGPGHPDKLLTRPAKTG